MLPVGDGGKGEGEDRRIFSNYKNRNSSVRIVIMDGLSEEMLAEKMHGDLDMMCRYK